MIPDHPNGKLARNTAWAGRVLAHQVHAFPTIGVSARRFYPERADHRGLIARTADSGAGCGMEFHAHSETNAQSHKPQKTSARSIDKSPASRSLADFVARQRPPAAACSAPGP